MADEQEDIQGIARLERTLRHALEASEQHAVKFGTQYVEDEQEYMAGVRSVANLMGGDITHPQFYAGMMAMVSFIITQEEAHPLARLFGGQVPLVTSNEVLMASRALSRIYDEVVKAGVQVIPDGQ